MLHNSIVSFAVVHFLIAHFFKTIEGESYAIDDKQK